MDILAGLAAMRLSHKYAVTASIERLDFRIPIRSGDIAVVEAKVVSVGRSSLVVNVDVFRDETQGRPQGTLHQRSLSHGRPGRGWQAHAGV